jgi:hypothetical protein
MQIPEIIVQVFADAGFSLEPEAQVVISGKGPFQVMGLRPNTYYVRAFVDQNGNGKLDDFETSGFVIDNEPFGVDHYLPKAIEVTSTIADQNLVLRDSDTDNDGIPDGWEYQFFDDLTTAGPGTDYDGDGLSDLREYELTLLDTDPTESDTDGDGLTDYQEVMWDGDEAYTPYHPVDSPMGTDLDPHNPDTDGDGLEDGFEVNTSGTNPLNADSDGDGARDGLEISSGSNPNLPDSDGDGVGDAFEIVLGSDPSNPGSVPGAPELVRVTSVVMAGPMTNDVYYDFLPQVTNIYADVVVGIESSTNLMSSFTHLPGSDQAIFTTNWYMGPWIHTDAYEEAGPRFYRSRWQIAD